MAIFLNRFLGGVPNLIKKEAVEDELLGLAAPAGHPRRSPESTILYGTKFRTVKNYIFRKIFSGLGLWSIT